MLFYILNAQITTDTDNLIKVQNLPYTAWNSGNPIGVGFVSGPRHWRYEVWLLCKS